MAAANNIPAMSAYKLKNLGGTSPYITRFIVGQKVNDVANPDLHLSLNLHKPFSNRASKLSAGSRNPGVKRR